MSKWRLEGVNKTAIWTDNSTIGFLHVNPLQCSNITPTPRRLRLR
jgi:hypothetical protein